MGAIRLTPSFSFSVLLHLLLLLLMGLGGWRGARLSPPRTLTWIEVEPIPQLKNRVDPSRSRQIVQSEQTKSSDRAAPDSFLGERTQVVDRQTVSSRENPQPEQSASRPTAKKVERSLAPGTSPSLANLGVALPRPGAQEVKQDLNEDRASLQAQARGEYVKGFKEGDKTLLNTREYVFYGYFQRIRDKLDRAWERTLKERLEKYFYRGRQLASDTDYVTQLLVTLDAQGQVIRVQMVGASGTRDLDEAAVKAFNEAGPFPNPPRGLIEADRVEVRWDFVLRT